jgi:hypothetical protein
MTDRPDWPERSYPVPARIRLMLVMTDTDTSTVRRTR